MQNIDVGHKKHLEQCSGSRKRKQGEGDSHVEIEGLDELEAEEEARLEGFAAAHAEGGEETKKPAKVIGFPCLAWHCTSWK